AVRDAGTPPIRRTRFHYGEDIVDIEMREVYGTDALYAPRRTVLDALLADAARAAGARVRYGISVHGVERDASGRVVGVRVYDRDGCEFVLHAGIVIGADGMRSTIARAVDARVERETRASAANMYAYFDGLEPGAYDWYFGDGVTAGVIPTNGGL